MASVGSRAQVVMVICECTHHSKTTCRGTLCRPDESQGRLVSAMPDLW